MESNRRHFLAAAGAMGLGAVLHPGASRAEEAVASMHLDEEARWAALEAPEGISQEQIKGMVFPSHFNLEAVKEQLAAEPRLVHARLVEFDEAPIEAASHTGNVEIADYLLGRGARFKIQAACMLGMLQAVEAFLDTRPELVTQPGAHKLPLMYHAAHSGKVAVCELLARRGGAQDFDFALHSAAEFDNVEIAQWLLAQGATTETRNQRGFTPLDSAIARGSAGVEQLLRDAGAVPSPSQTEAAK
ncbi:ankyrin repeat domain-containing protein [bacterium]|nr:ankyrin repeat domain-containing protein [bacterium]